MWILISHSYLYMKYSSYIFDEISSNMGQTFSIVFGWQPVYLCSWVKQRIYDKYVLNSQLFTSKSSQTSLISVTHGLFNVPLSISTEQLATSCEFILKCFDRYSSTAVWLSSIVARTVNSFSP